MASTEIWDAREQSWNHLTAHHPSRVAVLLQTFELIDQCVAEYEAESNNSTYARVCGLTLLKGKNLAQGSLSLVLDGLGQESGALLRPLIEYAELLTYLNQNPEQAENAAVNDLPKAGVRAKAISGTSQGLREHLNEHASHSSYSHYSLSHLLTPELSFRKLQGFVPHVLETNFTNLSLHVEWLLAEAFFAMQHLDTEALPQLALAIQGHRARMLSAFGLNDC